MGNYALRVVFIAFTSLSLLSLQCSNGFPGSDALSQLLALSGFSGGSSGQGGGSSYTGPGINLSAVSVITSENPATPASSFTIVLNQQPAVGQQVQIDVTSSALTEGTVCNLNAFPCVAGPTISLIFNATDWSTPKIIYVKGTDDGGAVDAVFYTAYTIQLALNGPGTTDIPYAGYNPSDVAAINLDDDTAGVAGVSLIPAAGLVTSEGGTSDQFAVILNKLPTAGVTINLTSTNVAEGTVSPAALSFTTGNWNVPQLVSVTGVNDLIVDGNIGYTITVASAASAAAEYAALGNQTVNVTNNDNDVAGISLSQSSLFLSESGASQTYTVVLNTLPTANVAFNITASDTTEAQVSSDNATWVATYGITFTTANWNIPQTVYVRGEDDFILDGNIGSSITSTAAVSGDAAYNGITPVAVTLTTFDNDNGGVPGFQVTPTSGLITSEFGTNASFGVVLNAAPPGGCTVNITFGSTNTNAANAPTAISFTSANWSTVQTVTVTGKNTAALTIDTAYNITTTASTAPVACSPYDGLAIADVALTHIANTPGVTVTPTTGLTVSESGTVATFSVNLNSKPTVNVTIDVTPAVATEAEASLDNTTYAATRTLTFTTANWNVPQLVYIRGKDDLAQDGNQNVNIQVLPTQSASDVDYTGGAINPADVTVTVVDDDTAGVTVTGPGAILTTESGASQTFSVVLNSMPAASVTVPISISDATEATITAPFAGTSGNLTFTTLNWNVAQTVTVMGVGDGAIDGNIAYTVVIGTTASADVIYSATFNPADLPATNLDDGVAPGFTIMGGPLNLTEGGLPGQVYIVLNTAPSANVVLPISNPVVSEYAIASPFTGASGTVAFTTLNWNVPQGILIVPYVNPIVETAPTVASLVIGPDTITSDLNYRNLNPADVVVNVSRNDKRAFLMRSSAGGPVVGSNGNLGGIVGADALCAGAANKPAGLYKALVIDGTTRVACTTPDCTIGGLTEHTDWVLQPNLPYYIAHGPGGPVWKPLMVPNKYGIVNFTASQSMLSKLHESIFAGIWTGLNPDWTLSPDTCSSWTSGGFGWTGEIGLTINKDYNALSSGGLWPDTCDIINSLLCVQQ